MKTKMVLMVSLFLNLALAALLGLRSKPPPPNLPNENRGARTANASAPADGQTLKPATVPAATAPAMFDWRMVESEDYKKYIGKLRSIGCPEETIRDIIIADVNKLYESKGKALAGPKKKFEFWKPGAGVAGAGIDPERTEKERALNKEKRALLIELLGSAPDETPDILADAVTQQLELFDYLPAEKRSKVFELLQDMGGKMEKAMKSGTPNPEGIRKAMKEAEAAMAAILTPEEMLDYNLRFSMTAGTMRAQLAGFEPSEQEFLDIFKMRKAYDDEFGMDGMGGRNLEGEEGQKQMAAEQRLNDQIKAKLGEERYQDYARAHDFAFQAMYGVADREGLGKDAAVKVYDMKKVAEEQTKKVQQDQSLTTEQRTAALQGIRAETENSIRAVFGDQGFQSYQKQSGAYWLNNITRIRKNAGNN